jgi:hypothetical protein
MKISKFKVENRKQWRTALWTIFPGVVPESARWTSLEDIKHVLSTIAQRDLNHMFLPSSGGLDLTAVRTSHEDGCLDLMTGRVAYVVRPSALIFESFPESITESYFRLETERLESSGTYPESTSDHEELTEIAPREYYHRSTWDEQSLGEDEQGSNIPLPPGSRLVIRYFGGAFLFVAKGSLYNAFPATYDARHNKMSAAEFRAHVRAMIESNTDWIAQMDPVGAPT